MGSFAPNVPNPGVGCTMEPSRPSGTPPSEGWQAKPDGVVAYQQEAKTVTDVARLFTLFHSVFLLETEWLSSRGGLA